MSKPRTPSPSKARTPSPTAKAEYSIDELARAADATVRNVRAYQDRGLLPPPTRRGRAGIYTEAHLARLRVIGQMLDRGYTLANIGELMSAWEQGQDIGHLLGLESALTQPWSEDLPAYFTMPALVRMFGKKLSVADTARVIGRAVELDILRTEGLRFRAPRPQLIHVAHQLVEMGIPLQDLLDILRMLRGNVERVADGVVQLVVQHVFDPYLKGKLPSAQEVPQLADTIWRLRPLADLAVDAEVSRAMEKAVNRYLGDVLSLVYEHLPRTAAAKKPGSTPKR
jgi:DNA-binding transcriptional MerR regulator